MPSPGYRRADKFVGVPGSVPYRPLSIEMSNTLPLPTYLEDKRSIDTRQGRNRLLIRRGEAGDDPGRVNPPFSRVVIAV